MVDGGYEPHQLTTRPKTRTNTNMRVCMYIRSTYIQFHIVPESCIEDGSVGPGVGM